MKRPAPRGLWQSFADLSMGVMAVVILVLLVVLERQADQNEQFTEAILSALEGGRAVVRGQDAVDTWLEALFDVSECKLSYDARSGRLTLKSQTGEAKELYATGRVSLRDQAQRELRQCGDALLTLSVCLNPESEDECARRLEATLGPARFEEIQERINAETAWTSVEALVIQGHTDRQRYMGARKVEGLPTTLEPHTESFIANAYLGAERARQAMGHLLAGVVESEARSAGAPASTGHRPTYDLLGHVAVESPSFGRFQANPNRPAEAHPECRDADCEAARRLALKVRWKRASLREPMEKVRAAFCERQFEARIRAHGRDDQHGLKTRVDAVCEDVREGFCTKRLEALLDAEGPLPRPAATARLDVVCRETRRRLCRRLAAKPARSRDAHAPSLNGHVEALCEEGPADAQP